MESLCSAAAGENERELRALRHGAPVQRKELGCGGMREGIFHGGGKGLKQKGRGHTSASALDFDGGDAGPARLKAAQAPACCSKVSITLVAAVVNLYIILI